MKNNDIVKKVRETRKLRGLTQGDIAKILNKTSSTVSDIERGKIQISASDLYKIANVLNKPIEYFFGDEFSDDKIQDLIFLIRKQPKVYQEKIIQQTRMFLSLGVFQEAVNETGRELTDQEVNEALKYVFQYIGDIEILYKQMSEIKKNLRDAFKSQGIDESKILNDK